MSRHTYHRSDGNQGLIVRDLRKLGIRVISLSSVGNGCPDLLCQHPQTGQVYLFEVKAGKGKLRDTQKQFAEVWDGVTVIRNTDEALKAIGIA